MNEVAIHVSHTPLTAVEVLAWYGSVVVFQLGQPLQIVSEYVIIKLHGRERLRWRVRLQAWHHDTMLLVRERHRRWPHCHLPLALLNNFFNSLNIVLGGTDHQLSEECRVQ